MILRSLLHYWRTNLAVVLGVGTAVAVLAGALLVGESVRASLRALALQRLGRADHVVSSTGFFREQLASDLRAQPAFAETFADACPIIALEGQVVHPDSGRRSYGVEVYGVDERFWKFHGRPVPAAAPLERDVLISPGLAQELEVRDGSSLVVRLAQPTDVPAASLYGRKDEGGRSLRVFIRGVLGASDLGEFSTRVQQADVRAVFFSLARLQKDLGRQASANALLLSERAPGAQPPDRTRQIAERLVRNAVSLEDLGIRLRIGKRREDLILESAAGFLSDALADQARKAAEIAFNTETAPAAAAERTSARPPRAGAGPREHQTPRHGEGFSTEKTQPGARATEVLTYLANTMRAGDKEIPYSLVTAVDLAVIHSQPPTPNPIVLNDWAARDLAVGAGDPVSLDYYLWHEDGRLETRSARFQVARVVPLEGAAADRDWTPDYPGISEASSLASWDPPFPVDLARVRPHDEEYWNRHRATPKAFVSLGVGQQLWGSRFGKLTSLRLRPALGAPRRARGALRHSKGEDLDAALQSYRQALVRTIDPLVANLIVVPVKAEGLAASRGATDFGKYFTYFSVFLVFSALLLTALFFKLYIEQRLREIGILRAVGFPLARIRRMFLSEAAALAAVGGLAGLAGARAYAALMMLGLRTWWVDAVGTTQLALHPSGWSLALGAAGGMLAAMAAIVWTLRGLGRSSPRTLLAGEGRAPGRSSSAASSFWAAATFGLAGLAWLVAASLGAIAQTAGFFGAGTCLLLSFLCWQLGWLRRDRRPLIDGHGWWAVSRLGFRQVSYRPDRSLLCIALIASATFIIVAIDSFRRDSRASDLDRRSGTGGFTLLAESLVPLQHDPNTAEGREALNLGDLDRSVLSGVRFSRFRLRAGDEASCLNLYQPRNPRILSPTDEFLREGRFSFRDSAATSPNPWLLLEREEADGAVPVIADANSLAYVLHLSVGDQMTLSHGSRSVRLRIVGALADSLFQSELLMSEANFLRLFPEESGFRFFLLDVSPERAGGIAAALEDRLADFGLDASAAEERLARFHRVENTYLSTFQTLGVLGLILGTLGLGTVLMRNVLERRRELALLRAVGYERRHFSLLVIAENATLLAIGLSAGAACALVAIVPAFQARGGRLSAVSLLLLLLAVLATGLASSVAAAVAAIRSPLLQALRTE